MQGIGGAAITVRSLVLIQLFAQKQSRSTPQDRGTRTGKAAPSLAYVKQFLHLASSAAKAAEAESGAQQKATPGPAKSPVLSPVYLQRLLQAFPRLMVRQNGRLRSPAAVVRKFWAARKAADNGRLIQSTDSGSSVDVQLTADAIAASTIDLFASRAEMRPAKVMAGANGAAHVESSLGAQGLPRVTDVSFTSITHDELSPIMSKSLLQSVPFASQHRPAR